MKGKLLFFSILLCYSSGSYAQWAVIDPTNIATSVTNMVKNVEAAYRTTGQTLEVYNQTKALYDENKKYLDALQSVSPMVTDYRKVKQSAKMLNDMSDMYVNDFRRFTSDPYLTPLELEVYMEQYKRRIKGATYLLEDMSKIVTRTGMSMTDKERIDRVDDIHRKMYVLNREMLQTQAQVQGISTRRENKKKQRQTLKELSGRSW